MSKSIVSNVKIYSFHSNGDGYIRSGCSHSRRLLRIVDYKFQFCHRYNLFNFPLRGDGLIAAERIISLTVIISAAEDARSNTITTTSRNIRGGGSKAHSATIEMNRG